MLIHFQQRSAGSMQQSQSSSSAKRARNVRKDGEGDSIDVDCDVFFVKSPERDFGDENTRNTAAVSAAAPSGDRHHADGNIPARMWNGLESTVMTAREALSALGPAEEGRGSLQEGIQLLQKKMSPDFATNPTGDSAPAGCCSIYENYRTNATSWSPSHSNPISSVQPAATVGGLDQTAPLKPIAEPKTNQSDSSSKGCLPSVGQTTNRDVMNTSLSPFGNTGHVISSSKSHEAENDLPDSNPISQIMNPSRDNALETSQAETRYYSLTAQNSAQLSQTLSPPNHQPSFANRVQSSPSNQSGEGITSPGDSKIISENWYSTTPSENSESFNCSDRVVNAPQVAANPQNSSQNGGDSQLPLERRFSQSFDPTETTVQQPRPPPSRRTDQDQDTQSTRLGPPGPPPPAAPPPASRQNAWPKGSPFLFPHASNQNQIPLPAPPPPGPPPPPASPKNRWSNGPPPPPPPRTSNQNQGPPPPPISQYARPNGPPPPPPPRTSDQNQGPPPPPISRNARPNGPPPPPPPRTSDQNQGPPPLPHHPISTQNRSCSAPQPSPSIAIQNEALSARPPRPPPSIIPQYQRPPGTPPVQCRIPPPSPAQGSPSYSAASTQHQSLFPTDASNSVAGPPPPQFQSLGQQQPSSSPWYSAQHIGQPPPAPTQNQPVGPPLAESGSASGITFPNSTPALADQISALAWKKYNEMVIIHVPISVQTDANPIDTGPRALPTRMFPAGDVFKQTIVELFHWISGLLSTTLPSQLVFDFIDVQSKLERRMILYPGDSKLLEAVKTIVWEHFREIASLDPAVTNVKILIMPLFSAASGSGGENMQQQSQQLHSTNTASTIPSDQTSYLPLPNESSSSIASDSSRRPSTTKSGGPPPFGPPPQYQSSFSRSPAPDSINSQGEPPKSAPGLMPVPNKKTTPKRNVPHSNNNIVEAHAPSNPDPQRQSQQQPAQLPAPNSTKSDNSPSTAKIVIRIQIDGHGRLSRGYDNSTLNTRVTSARFFAWFAQETGHTRSGQLRFDFKDALPAKYSVIEAGNDDHFDLMVCDIKRKFERAKNLAPDMHEFCIVVTDPLWDSGDEGDDE